MKKAIFVLLALCSVASAKGRLNDGKVTVKPRVVEIARKDLGIGESDGRYWDVVSKCGFKRRVPWCAAMVADWLLRSGYTIKRTAAVSELRRQAEKGWKSVDAKPGSVVFFEWSHVGIVSRLEKSGFWSIEGNCSRKVRERFHPWHHAAEFFAL